jgi:D-alanine transaminase
MLVYLNGEYLPRSEARVSVDDRGFLFGDGVYEVTRSVGGRLFEEEAHWRRLEWGLGQLAIQPPEGFGREAVRDISERLLRDNGLMEGDATVCVQVTRGAAPRSHGFPPAGTPPTVYLAASALRVPWELRARGVKVVGTTTDVQPVVSVDGVPVGEGRPGPVGRALQAALYLRMGVSAVAEEHTCHQP